MTQRISNNLCIGWKPVGIIYIILSTLLNIAFSDKQGGRVARLDIFERFSKISADN